MDGKGEAGSSLWEGSDQEGSVGAGGMVCAGVEVGVGVPVAMVSEPPPGRETVQAESNNPVLSIKRKAKSKYFILPTIFITS
jgi:hypothetical protein